MERSAFFDLYGKTLGALDEDRLSLALDLNQQLLLAVDNKWELNSELEQIRQSYALMLDYIGQGSEQLDNKQPYEAFLAAAYGLADKICRAFVLQQSVSYVAQIWKESANGFVHWTDSIPMLSKSYDAEFEQTYQAFFNAVWASSPWRDDDLNAATDVMLSPRIREDYKLILLSAAMLSALTFFDAKKFLLLCNFSTVASARVSARAMIGLLLVYKKHHKRIRLYGDIVARLNLLCDEPLFARALCSLHIRGVLIAESKNIERNLREEIIPGIMKGARKNLDFRKFDSKSIEEVMEEVASNPEWQDSLADKEMERQMSRFVDLQNQGADIFISSFSTLKQQFPFFSTAANWFCPFSSEHPAVGRSVGVRGFIKTMFSGNKFCDSDKFSLIFMMQQMKSDVLPAMGGMQQADLGGEVSSESEDERREVELRNYMQDVYRFFTLFRHRDALSNPFQGELEIIALPIFDGVLLNVDHLRRSAKFLFKHEYYKHALDLYRRIPEKERTAEEFQKMGFCLQTLKFYAEAAMCYEHSVLLVGVDAWTLFQLGLCYRADGKLEEAVGCYERLERMKSEDVGVLLNLSECLLQLGRYEDSRSWLFKANYLDAGNLRVLRALSWCLLLTGEMERAITYLEKIISLQPDSVDYYNLGHAHLLQKHIPEALWAYRKSLEMQRKPFANSDFFDEDFELLKKGGFGRRELHLFTDLINANET